MVRKRGDTGILLIVIVFFLIFVFLSGNYFRIAFEQEYVSAAEQRSEYTIKAEETQGTIYDCNMRPLVNKESKFYAAVVPYAADIDSLEKYAADRKDFRTKAEQSKPFVFECKKKTPESDGVTVFEIPERYSQNQSAQHIVGYLSQKHGASGIEYAYDMILRGDNGENSVTYNADGFGRIMIGDGKKVNRSKADISGVVTTIDSDIQQICENNIPPDSKGAIVVTNVYNGDILALASFPVYSANKIETALDDKSSPLINRALYSYSVGSIFKLVTACDAINEGKRHFLYDCTGNIEVYGQNFNCHKFSGHGNENLTSALRDSCNTYFIALSEKLDIKKFRELAHDLGFGKENQLCTGIVGSAGVLPTKKELEIPAELANFSFGQGKLSATPLQINQMTCAMANGGELPVLRLIRGITLDGENVLNEKNPQSSKVISDDTAAGLKRMMTAAVRDSENSNARSKKVKIAAKTSTAQTGRFDKDGNEYCHAWITGFFPSDSPQYAITVLIEDGGYGNDTAAPVFRKIAEEITALSGQ